MTSSALQEIVALLGNPAAGNPAQYLFERALNSVDLDWRFLTLDVERSRLSDAITGISALGFRGCLLAPPLQEAALQCIENITPSARFSGVENLAVSGSISRSSRIGDRGGWIEYFSIYRFNIG